MHTLNDFTSTCKTNDTICIGQITMIISGSHRTGQKFKAGIIQCLRSDAQMHPQLNTLSVQIQRQKFI